MWPIKNFQKHFMDHQYIPKIFHDPCKNPPVTSPTHLMYGPLEDLPRIVLIHEECGSFGVFVDRGELTRYIYEKKNPGVLQAYRCPLCDKCFRGEYFFNKHVEYFESVR